MPDRNMVIESMENCLHEKECDDCPYEGCIHTHGNCIGDLMAHALLLLKEQEAVEPEAEILNEIDRIYRCPKCHKAFFYENQKYCDHCGQKVKWNA